MSTKSSALNAAVNELAHAGKPQYTSLLFPVPVRLQSHLFGMVEAMTHHAGTSRNKWLNTLIEIGIEETLKSLPPETVEQLEQAAENALAVAMEKNAGQLERGDL